MTSTIPMMDRVHVQPLAAGMPMALSPSWKAAIMAETSHLNGAMTVPKKSTDIPNPQVLQSYGETGRLSRAPAAGGPAVDREQRETPTVERWHDGRMSQVTCDLTISLDGVVAGPHQSLTEPLGEGGELLHRWQFEERGSNGAAGSKASSRPALTSWAGTCSSGPGPWDEGVAGMVG